MRERSEGEEIIPGSLATHRSTVRQTEHLLSSGRERKKEGGIERMTEGGRSRGNEGRKKGEKEGDKEL